MRPWGLGPRLLILPGLLLAACEAAPEAGAPSTVQPDLTAAELAVRLPAEAALFRRGATTPVPLGGGGLETGYRTPGRIAAGATVELYRQPGERVPEGAESPTIAAAFDQLVEEATRPAPHRRLQAGQRFTLPAAGPAALRCAETAGVYGREHVQGLLCAGGLAGGVLRLRVTMPQRDPPPGDGRAFADAILAALRATP